jgi:hypothetical protein
VRALDVPRAVSSMSSPATALVAIAPTSPIAAGIVGLSTARPAMAAGPSEAPAVIPPLGGPWPAGLEHRDWRVRSEGERAWLDHAAVEVRVAANDRCWSLDGAGVRLCATVELSRAETYALSLRARIGDAADAAVAGPYAMLVYDRGGLVTDCASLPKGFLHDRVVSYAMPNANGLIPLLGGFPILAPGRHRLELSVRDGEVLTRLDDTTLYRGRHHLVGTSARLSVCITSAKDAGDLQRSVTILAIEAGPGAAWPGDAHDF